MLAVTAAVNSDGDDASRCPLGYSEGDSAIHTALLAFVKACSPDRSPPLSPGPSPSTAVHSSYMKHSSLSVQSKDGSRSRACSMSPLSPTLIPKLWAQSATARL